MQSLNNDMDDLFRRAAEDYPLNTDSRDWDKVMKELESGRNAGMLMRSYNLERFFWMAAIFVVVVCTTFIQKTEPVVQHDRPTTSASNHAIPQATDPGKEPGTVQIDKEGSVPIDPEKGLAPHQKLSQAVNPLARAESPFLMLPKESVNGQETAHYPKVIKDQPGKVELETVTKSVGQLPPGDQIQLPAKNDDLAATETVKEKTTDKKSILQKMYAGVIAGPDISTVKSQKVSNTGYSIGVIAGYQFNKRLSLESGVLWDRKDYYTSGKYFNKGKLGLPQHAKVIEVDGYCQMFEIPVNLKFNWVHKSNHQLFATAGISSYLMKREDYEYSYDYYGTQYNYYKEYKNASRNWLSIVNFSIGYERKIGNAGSLRIEPYLKLPVRKLGVGDLPFESKGVFIGFTRPIQ